MQKTEKPRILYLDDDQSNLDSFKANFRKNFEIHAVTNPIEAYNLIDEHDIQIVVTDHNMPSISGVEFLESVAKDYPNVQRILLTGFTELISVVDAVNRGKVFRIITKPFNLTEIKSMLFEAFDNFSKSIEKDNLIAKLQRQNQQFEFILRQRLIS